MYVLRFRKSRLFINRLVAVYRLRHGGCKPEVVFFTRFPHRTSCFAIIWDCLRLNHQTPPSYKMASCGPLRNAAARGGHLVIGHCTRECDRFMLFSLPPYLAIALSIDNTLSLLFNLIYLYSVLKNYINKWRWQNFKRKNRSPYRQLIDVARWHLNIWPTTYN